jgi:hypothetical protein
MDLYGGPPGEYLLWDKNRPVLPIDHLGRNAGDSQWVDGGHYVLDTPDGPKTFYISGRYDTPTLQPMCSGLRTYQTTHAEVEARLLGKVVVTDEQTDFWVMQINSLIKAIEADRRRK